ncbi:iron-sulfur cluster co-chaperone protein HscB [Frankliniella occidentalis]|uniref:Iron-sulfur cluster co-chaperone protein HscB n=1 Tax=Frankliniella occidentalis TaxID=133901 RepID=A0A6J1TAS1_FRAOC|nr:iron-sulfur cluster co-chaperone protein HscB [Frankliniella occidentalis]
MSLASASRLLRRASSSSFCSMIRAQKCVPSTDFIHCRPETKEQNFLTIPSHFYSVASSNSAPSCWKCGGKERKSSFFCNECSALQKPESNYNYFQLLGVIQTFNIDAHELSKKFRDLQTVLHPDKFSNASEDEQSFSAELSSLVNKAFKTLLDPLERGLYLLSLVGDKVDEKNTSFDKIFLLEIMELNEELEAISTTSELKEFQSRNKSTLNSICRKVSVAFDEGNYTSAKAALMEMKYYTTLEGKIKEKEISIETV